MKLKNKIAIAIIVLTGFMGINVVSAATMPPTSYKTSWNIESIYYYIDQSAPGYSGTISAAANNWVYTGVGYNKLYPNTRTYDKNGTLAYTSLFKRVNGNPVVVTWKKVSGRVDTSVPSESWLFSEIHINNDVFQDYGFDHREGTLTHELGHAWGLGHNNENQNSVMCQTGYGRKVNKVQKVDNDAFNALYN